MKRKSSRKGLSILLVAFMTLATVSVLTTQVMGATEAEMEASGAAAVVHLASLQNPDGSWGSGDKVAVTGLVLLKFLARAQELSKARPPPPIDPFDNDPMSPSYYEYADNVIAGFDYLLSNAYDVSISMQTHGNPDTNGNGKGICFGNHVYNTGIALTALAISGHPDDRSAVIGTLGLLTYGEIAQDVADWLYFAQGDSGNARGGFNYGALDNSGVRTDNSNGGYAYLGLAFAEDPPFSCIVPDWVRDELNIYIDWIQNDVDGDADDGGSGYTHPDNWVNILKTGNLIFEMAFYGDTPNTTRVQDAVDYLERHWQDANTDPGWGYSLPVANYQAKFLVEKGLTYMGIDLIDTDGDSVSDDNWFNQEPPAVPPQDFASVIVSQQLPSGGWPRSDWDGQPNNILSTAWAVLTLERFAPPEQFIPVPVDVKPASWPNPLQLKERGVLPVAICGTEEFDVTTVDPATIQLTLEGLGVGVAPLRWSYEDVATPYMGEPCSGHDLGPDGYLDLTLKFKAQEVIATLGLDAFSDGDVIILVLTGALMEEFDGTRIQGQDCVVIRHK
jgi:hypothetical protein